MTVIYNGLISHAPWIPWYMISNLGSWEFAFWGNFLNWAVWSVRGSTMLKFQVQCLEGIESLVCYLNFCISFSIPRMKMEMTSNAQTDMQSMHSIFFRGQGNTLLEEFSNVGWKALTDVTQMCHPLLVQTWCTPPSLCTLESKMFVLHSPRLLSSGTWQTGCWSQASCEAIKWSVHIC